MSSCKNFFKIILYSNLHNYKLRLPDRFVKKHGDELSYFVKLMVPNGETWCVGVEKTENSIWLHEGMRNFMEDLCIRLGYFLIFKYKRDSTFKIRILNLTSFEIEYPTKCDSPRLVHEDDNGHLIENGDEEKDESSIEIWGSSIDRNDKLRPKRCYLTRNRKQKIQDEIAPVSSSESDSTVKKYRSTGNKDSLEKKPIEEANISFSNNPCYSVVIRPYNLHKNVMGLPIEFRRMYMSSNKMEMKLEDDDGNEWKIWCISERNCQLSKGWKSFVKAKKLMVGDVCVFEPVRINEEALKLKVKIYRANESASNVK